MLFPLVIVLAGLDVPMPPSSPGVDVQAEVLASKPWVDATPDAFGPRVAPAEDPEPPTTELEALRTLEDSDLELGARSDLSLRMNLHQLGYTSAVRQRLECALDEADVFGEELPFELAPVTDLANFDVSRVKDRYDIPVEMRPLVVQYIHFFQGAGRYWFRNWMSRSTRYIPVMQPILESKGLPRDLVYLSMIESGFNPTARSWAAAVGPWQFMPATGQRFKLRNDFWVDERRDAVKSTYAAAGYLGELYGQLGHWYLAWAGYNTGGSRVRKMIDYHHTSDFWVLSTGRKGFAKETKHYVPKLIACALIAKHPEAFGFKPEEFQYEQPLQFDEVQLPWPVDLDVLARAAAISIDELLLYNPELKRWCTPPSTQAEPYVLRIPKTQSAVFATNFARFSPGERLNFVFHRVKKGDTVSQIAHTYNSAPEAILRMNGLKSAKALRINWDLIVPTPNARALKAGRPDVIFERQVAQARKSYTAVRPEDEIPAGTVTARPSAPTGTVKVEQVEGKTRVTYGVASGDSLWTISQKFDCTVADLENWNAVLERGAKRMQIGTTLTIWPGPRAKP